MPAPFEWIKIPKKGYSIAKYPVTNTQFAKFIDAGGYTTERWWTKDGWQQRQKDGWTEPLYWQDSKWNGAEQPVVGVSWFEAVAFCLGLSEVTDEKIMLPTGDQWRLAGSRGNYPWGDTWNNTKCNNAIKEKVVLSEGVLGFGKKTEKRKPRGVPTGHGERTTPVKAYESVGASFFGVVDMAGNVWEWCLTDRIDRNIGTSDVNSTARSRQLRGGCWRNNLQIRIGCHAIDYGYPNSRNDNRSFRLACS